jgi:hypothetical protein
LKNWDFKKEGPQTIAMVCKAGVNRSVTCAFILAEVLHHRGYIVHLQHLQEANWTQRGICPGTCSNCGDKSEQRVQAIKFASHCWDSMY